MKHGSSKLKLNKKLSKQARLVLDWDNKKQGASLIRRMSSATSIEKDFNNSQNEKTI